MNIDWDQRRASLNRLMKQTQGMNTQAEDDLLNELANARKQAEMAKVEAAQGKQWHLHKDGRFEGTNMGGSVNQPMTEPKNLDGMGMTGRLDLRQQEKTTRSKRAEEFCNLYQSAEMKKKVDKHISKVVDPKDVIKAKFLKALIEVLAEVRAPTDSQMEIVNKVADRMKDA